MPEDKKVTAMLMGILEENQRVITDNQETLKTLVEKIDKDIVVNVPEVKVPEIKIPDFPTPQINIPETKIPQINIPQITVPEVKLPPFPEMPVPQFNVNGITVTKESTEWEVEITERDFSGRIKKMTVKPVIGRLN